MKLQILLAGEGGQGIQTIAKIISRAAANAGKEVSYIPSFGVEQRGTPSLAFLIIGDEIINYPRFDVADELVVLQQRAILTANKYVSPNTTIIFDSSTINHRSLLKTAKKVLGAPVTKYAFEKFTPKSFNIIITGKLSHQLGLDKAIVWEVVAKTLGKKLTNPEIMKATKAAFEFGYDLTLEEENFSEPSYLPETSQIVMKGFGKTAYINPKSCKGCGICIEKCPVKALAFGETLGVYATPVPDIDLEKCITCGNCKRFCPDAAIKVDKDKKA